MRVTEEQLASLLETETDTSPFRAQEGPQRRFGKTSADIAILGGAAGGGKTFSLLLDPLRYVHDFPGFGGVIFRRTYPEVTAEGGIWDQASEIYPEVGGVPKLSDLSWSFPPYGNTISFGHLEHEDSKYRWASSQICYLAFDELFLFKESQFFFMLSRNRSLCGVPPYVRAATNPDPGWLRTFLAPWVSDEFEGVRAASGEIRSFVRDGGAIKWVPNGTTDAKSVTFIRSTVYDNKILLDRNPEYLANLKALPPVERSRLLDGDWNVRREGLVYAGFESCIVDHVPEHLEGIHVGGIDFGFHNPFVAIAGILDGDDVLWLTWMRYKSGATLPVHSEALPKHVRWWCDPAEPGLIGELNVAGHHCVPCVHRPMRGASGETRSPKLGGIDMVSERMRTGRLKILRSTCAPLIRELGMYSYDPEKTSEEPIKEDDHGPDGLRYLIVGLSRGHYVPSVTNYSEIVAREKALVAAETEKKATESQAFQAARHASIDDAIWWQEAGESSVTMLVVEAKSPEALDSAVAGLGPAEVVTDDQGAYVAQDGGWAVRIEDGKGDYISWAIGQQGCGKVLSKRRL